MLLLWLSLILLAGSGPAGGVCVPAAERLCLLDGRFELEVTWRDAATGATGVGRAAALSDGSGTFYFFAESNLELGVKMLDGGGYNGHFWLFYGSLTTLELELRVRDLETGAVRTYLKPQGQAAGGSDPRAFLSSPSARDPDPHGPPKDDDTSDGEPCTEDPAALCLHDGRFLVTATWRAFDGSSGTAGARRLTDETGYLHFFEPSNAEVLVKVLDGTPINGAYWVFYGAMSNLEIELAVTDTSSGRVRRYRNPLGTQGSLADTRAFHVSKHPPLAPTILEPASDGEEVSPFDVHMEVAPFVDPDPGDGHFCSGFEIVELAAGAPAERVWSAPCVTGIEKLHVHLGDGRFEGSREGQRSLAFDGEHLLRVRFRDDTGVWGSWAERRFETGPFRQVFPLLLASAVASPEPEWRAAPADGGAPIGLPVAAVPPSLRLGSAAGDRFLEAVGAPGGLEWSAGAPIAEHRAVRVTLDAGNLAGSLELPASELRFHAGAGDGDGEEIVLYLPAARVEAGSPLELWVSSNGSTFFAEPGQSEPDFSHLARHTRFPWVVGRPGFELEVAAEGLRLPVGLAFPPSPGGAPDDPFFYVAELYGTVQVVSRSGVVSPFASDLLDFDPAGNFPGSGEMGLVGMVVEPASGDLFVSLVYRLDDGGSEPAFSGRVLRLESLDGGRRAGAVTTVLDLAPSLLAPSHQISSLTLGPDGKLYVHVGDGLQPERSQDLDSHLGKVLRFELDGSAPADNPFYDASDGIGARDYVYAYGLRNPFGGAWRVADGALYAVDNGPAVDRLIQVEPGANYGWDLDQDGRGSDDEMLIGAIYNWQPSHAPVNLAFVQAETFGGSGFPAALQDRALVSLTGPTYLPGPIDRGKRLAELALDAAGELVEGPLGLVDYDGHGRASVVAVAAGPDGVYFSDFYKDLPSGDDPTERGARVWRLRWVGGCPSSDPCGQP